jgi:hypothetical protein
LALEDLRKRALTLSAYLLLGAGKVSGWSHSYQRLNALSGAGFRRQ